MFLPCKLLSWTFFSPPLKISQSIACKRDSTLWFDTWIGFRKPTGSAALQPLVALFETRQRNNAARLCPEQEMYSGMNRPHEALPGRRRCAQACLQSDGFIFRHILIPAGSEMNKSEILEYLHKPSICYK